MKVFYFDTETSGVNDRENGIIQLAYMLEIDGTIEKEGELFSNCEGKQITERALEINRYTPDMIKGFPPPSDMYKKLHALFNKYVNAYDRTDKMIAAGYNADFDLRFLRRLWFDNGDKFFGSFFAFGILDPGPLFRYLQWKNIIPFEDAKMTLTDIATYFAIDTTDAHDALADIKMTREILLKIDKLIRKKSA
jgi:DNA polymerase III subunit epsilon